MRKRNQVTPMQKKTRRGLIAVLVILVCVFLSAGGWLWYDANVDRSGWLQEEGVYYYQDFHARKVTGWREIDGNYYYFAEDYAMQTHWQEIGGNRYYFGADGALDTGWLDIDGNRYYAGSDGILRSGWQEIDGQQYYFGSDDAMVTGWQALDGTQYHFSSDGSLSLGFYTEDGNTYYFGDDGVMTTGYRLIEEALYYFQDSGIMQTGWMDTEEGRSYFQEDGPMVTGWQELEEKRYYFGEDGIMVTGWYQEGEYSYYFQEDGAAAVGPLEVEGQTHYFSPAGIHVVLVNRTHSVPEYYDADLVTYTDWFQVSQVCLEPLTQMLADCKAAGNNYTFNSAYRSIAQQSEILRLRTEEYMEAYELSYDAARARALQSVAVPGTSEHHLGLAVDIVGANAQAWLAEHCWEYGFILRYTEEKQHITGFINEPWHFRYVGVAVSMDMKDSGLCLEEYLGAYVAEESESQE